MAYKGRFVPKAPEKYKGDPTRIIYRSLWELKLMKYLDSHNDVLYWASEEFSIPYRSPIDGRMHRYFPDFWVKKKNSLCQYMGRRMPKGIFSLIVNPSKQLYLAIIK